MKFYLKQGFFPFVYMLFMAAIAFGILAIQGLVWLKVILGILNIGLYAVVVCATSFKDGQDAMKIQVANDLERREIIRTGEDRPLRLHEEYKPWKGFIFGLIACAPLIILLIVHTIVYFATGSYTGIGAIAGLIYLMFFIFFRLSATGTAVEGAAAESVAVPFYVYYGTLIAVPLVMLMTGISYILGAKKIQRQQEMIKEKQRQIYGD